MKLKTQRFSLVANKTVIFWSLRTEKSEDQSQDLITSSRVPEKGEFSVLQSLICLNQGPAGKRCFSLSPGWVWGYLS